MIQEQLYHDEENKERCFSNPSLVLRENKRSPLLSYARIATVRNLKSKLDVASIEQLTPVYPFKDFQGASDPSLCVYGYVYINKGKALPKSWQGLNARVKNVTIEMNTFFGCQEDQEARVRIGGEILIENLDENHAIQSNRSGFAAENSDYRLFARYIREFIIRRAIEDVRKSSQIDSAVKKIVNKVAALYTMCDCIAKIQDDKEDAAAFQALNDESLQLEQPPRFDLEQNIQAELDKLDVSGEVVWSGVIIGDYYVERHDDDFYTVHLKTRYQTFSFDVGGKTVEFVLSFCGEKLPFAVKKEGIVYLNLSNPSLGNGDITKVDVEFLRVVLVLYLNYLRCDGSAEGLYVSSIQDLSTC